MSPDSPTGAPSRTKVLAAFAAVYIIWGSTYLAIRIAIETLPPFLMAAVRFLVAGGVLYAWARFRGAGRPTRAHWTTAFVVGGLLLLGGNGAVVWAEQRVPSGVASLLVATVPLWIVLLDWLRGGARPGPGTIAGVVLGLLGLGLLVEPGSVVGGAEVDTIGALVLVAGSLAWAVGSLWSRQHKSADSPMLGTAMQMLAGGALLLLLSLATGDAARVEMSAITGRSLLALLYLISFGSLVGFTAYIWLLGASTPARVATYAYVNPVVAVFLGWLVLGEAVTPRVAIAAGVIVAAVALITAATGTGPRRTGAQVRRIGREAEEPAVELRRKAG